MREPGMIPTARAVLKLQVRWLQGALDVEHETQRLILERLKINWPDGEPFYAVVEQEILALRKWSLL